MSNYYEGKVCLVTGSSSGIGKAIALELLKRGAKVCFSGHSGAEREKVAEYLTDTERTRYVTADVSVPADVDHMVAVAEELGEIDILFNNAGICRAMFYQESTDELWQEVVGINLLGVAYGTNRVLPKMLKRGYGQIVNTSSISGLVPTPLEVIYTASKFGVVGFTEAIRIELADSGVDFSVICPSEVNTPMFNNAVYHNGKIVTEMDVSQRVMVEPHEAAVHILEQVEAKTPIILVGHTAQSFLDLYRSPNGDANMKKWTENRKRHFESVIGV